MNTCPKCFEFHNRNVKLPNQLCEEGLGNMGLSNEMDAGLKWNGLCLIWVLCLLSTFFSKHFKKQQDPKTQSFWKMQSIHLTLANLMPQFFLFILQVRAKEFGGIVWQEQGCRRAHWDRWDFAFRHQLNERQAGQKESNLRWRTWAVRWKL